MIPPVIGFVTWHRLGLTIQNLKSLLETNEDFELYVVDNDSKDNTRQYLSSLSDSRIKEIKFLDKNYGLIYALNYCISKRHKDQDFINIDADVNILTKDWLTNNRKVLKEFIRIGILGNARPSYFEERKVTYEEIIRKGIKFWKVKDCLIGCFMHFKSKILNKFGYFNEEFPLGDIDICRRIEKQNHWLGYCPDNLITQEQHVNCQECHKINKGICSDNNGICLTIYNNNYNNSGHKLFYKENYDSIQKYLQQIREGKIQYCKSIFGAKK